MILRVIDSAGRLVHDCAASGCDVSWDGYLLADGSAAEGRAELDAALWRVEGDTAYAIGAASS